MEKEIVQGPIGAVGTYDVEFKGGKLVAKAEVSREPVGGIAVKADLSIEIAADPVVDLVINAAEQAIPGEIDNMVLDKVRVAVKAWLAAQ